MEIMEFALKVIKGAKELNHISPTISILRFQHEFFTFPLTVKHLNEPFCVMIFLG